MPPSVHRLSVLFSFYLFSEAFPYSLRNLTYHLHSYEAQPEIIPLLPYGPAECTALALDTPLPAGRSGAHRLASAAADFAAKEAFLKAAGTGLREPFALREIEAVRLESGAPAYRFSGATARWVADHGLTAHLSLSHDGGMALAFCILETAPET